MELDAILDNLSDEEQIELLELLEEEENYRNTHLLYGRWAILPEHEGTEPRRDSGVTNQGSARYSRVPDADAAILHAA